MIKVVNKKTHIPTANDVYIGRPSPLGNPYPLPQYSRDESIRRYKGEFLRMMELKQNTNHLNYVNCRIELLKIYNMHLKGEVNLVCWCAPLACHGDVIKRFIESYPSPNTRAASVSLNSPTIKTSNSTNI